ncbi:MAG: phosphatase PAP2 family protein [Desulforhopalus sp.]
MDAFFVTITWCGSLYVLLPLAALVCAALVRFGKPQQAVLFITGFTLTILATYAAKLIFRRPRPPAVDLLVAMPSSWSFPSAHMAQATAFCLSITFIAYRLLRSSSASLVAFFCVLLAGCIGYSRIYLHVHYASDVLGGMVLAALIVGVVQVIGSRLSKSQKK